MASIGTIVIKRQFDDLASAVRTMHVDIPESVTLDPLASIVVDPMLLEKVAPIDPKRPALMDRYQMDPNGVSVRSALALTWLNASLVAKSWHPGDPKSSRIGSQSLPDDALAKKTDAWGNPDCLFAYDRYVVAISSWNKGPLDCSSFAEAAQESAISAHSAILTVGPKETLVTVQPRAPQPEN